MLIQQYQLYKRITSFMFRLKHHHLSALLPCYIMGSALVFSYPVFTRHICTDPFLPFLLINTEHKKVQSARTNHQGCKCSSSWSETSVSRTIITLLHQQTHIKLVCVHTSLITLMKLFAIEQILLPPVFIMQNWWNFRDLIRSTLCRYCLPKFIIFCRSVQQQ